MNGVLFIKTNFEESVWCVFKKKLQRAISNDIFLFDLQSFFSSFNSSKNFIISLCIIILLNSNEPLQFPPNQSENFKQVRWRFLMIFSMSSSERLNDIVKMNGTHTNHLFNKTWQPSIYISLVFRKVKCRIIYVSFAFRKKLKQKKKIGKVNYICDLWNIMQIDCSQHLDVQVRSNDRTMMHLTIPT